LFVSEIAYGACWTDRVYTVNCVRLYCTYYYIQSGNNIYVSRLTHLLLKVLPLPFIACVTFNQYCFTSSSGSVRIKKLKRLGTHEVAIGDSGKNLKIRDHSVNLGIDWRIILKLVLK